MPGSMLVVAREEGGKCTHGAVPIGLGGHIFEGFLDEHVWMRMGVFFFE